MCQHTNPNAPVPLAAIALALRETSQPAPLPPIAPALCTRRRRLWDLDAHAHCPLVGVCVPIAALRRLADKVRGGSAAADDYELHTGAVAECRQRNRMSEALQKHLDQRYQLVLRRAAKLKTTEELAAWWIEASGGHDLPGAFWAVLTHPRCTSTLEYAVLGQVHMLQHQVGMATRVELERFEALIDENAVLARELCLAQGRSMRQAAGFAERVDALESELVRQRALTVAGQTALAQQREMMATLEAAVPQLRERHALARQVTDLRAQMQDLQRQLTVAREAARRQRLRADTAQQCAPSATLIVPPAPTAAAPAEALRPLADRAVLCVGGRTASVSLYRLVIERTGGRFLHHDGGEEDNPAKLDATLTAADLVICQTGCVSHDAYWRVKDHCKRTGKRCVFVETPSRSALERALALATATTADSTGDLT
jgi:Uncharacterized protein conserved in bacteria (DUF2325)